MGFLAVLNAYTMRIALSIAITEMVATPNRTNVIPIDSCPYQDDEPVAVSHVSQAHKDVFDWNDETQGLILSSFYWGYIISHLPGGILAEMFGGKYALGLGILSTAVFTILTPMVARTTNWLWLCLLRMCVGLGEGTTFPALNFLLAKWVPLGERSKLGSLTFAGSLLGFILLAVLVCFNCRVAGTVIANLVGGVLIAKTGDWASVFYLFGGIGVLWFIIWTLLCYSEPKTHPFISDKERIYLEKELKSVSNERSPTPWKAIATSAPLWALVAAQIGHDWGFYAMVTDLPKYMKDVLKFSVAENGIWSSLPYALMWIVSISSGWLCDWLIKKKYCEITFARKFFTAFGAIVPGFLILGASYTGCDRVATVVLFTLAMGAMGTFYCGLKVNALDLSPNFAGTLMAVVNGIGAICGIITPYLIGAITSDHTITQWRSVFWITLAILVGTSIIYIFWASGEEQRWNVPKSTSEDDENEDIDLESIKRISQCDKV